MATPPTLEVLEGRLQKLYDKLPTVKCVGKCWRSCTRIQMTQLERRLILRDYPNAPEIPQPIFPTPIEPMGSFVCPALDMGTKQCSIYERRPYICRAFGTTEGLQCYWGCEVTPGHLSDSDTMDLDHAIKLLGKSETETVAYVRGYAKKVLQSSEGRQFMVQLYDQVRIRESAWWQRYMLEHPDAELGN